MALSWSTTRPRVCRACTVQCSIVVCRATRFRTCHMSHTSVHSRTVHIISLVGIEISCYPPELQYTDSVASLKLQLLLNHLETTCSTDASGLAKAAEAITGLTLAGSRLGNAAVSKASKAIRCVSTLAPEEDVIAALAELEHG